MIFKRKKERFLQHSFTEDVLSFPFFEWMIGVRYSSIVLVQRAIIVIENDWLNEFAMYRMC